MILNIIYLLLGMAFIVGGAHFLTEGAVSMARKWGISPLVIGLTIVAFGTSMPELAVSCISALKGNPDIAIGNVIGSNIFNIFMILGITAMITPLKISISTVKVEIPLVILASVVLFVMAMDITISGQTMNILSRGDGIVLLAFFIIFLAYTFAISKKQKPSSKEEDQEFSDIKVYATWLSILMFLGGLGALIFGGDAFVKGASGIALSFGVSQSLIGLTIVAMGTSLPELATSIAAALKKQPDIAVGNVVGSNIFNIFFILGVSSTITPIRPSGIGMIDYIVLMISAVMLCIFALFFGKKTITRGEGLVLTLCMIAYTSFLIYQG
ncbi:calcium/sodium antiporter [Porphyromonas pogonae]|uniref:calcium/sodium antiporter n=1 Tax=Porphyromonas pogonae TaxID=867595 RepID=UPI002E7684D3|nr:calcium/sodium antiporter [Porphyromonas pogonae]